MYFQQRAFRSKFAPLRYLNHHLRTWGTPAANQPPFVRVHGRLETYHRITAPVLAVDASDNSMEKWWKGQYTLAEYYERLKAVPTLQTAHIHDTGHMLHHDQPVAVARLIEKFLK